MIFTMPELNVNWGVLVRELLGLKNLTGSNVCYLNVVCEFHL